MRTRSRAGLVVALLLTGACIGGSGVAQAQSALRRPYAAAAERAFYGLAADERADVHRLLIATGDFNAMLSDRFGGRLYDAVASFQRAQGLPETGILSPDVLAQLRAVGGPILASWQMQAVDHPAADVTLTVPGSFGLVPSRTQHGWAFENARHTFSVDFAFFPDDELPMAEIFARLSAPLPNRRMDMRVLRADFFAVAGGGDRYGTYSRYIAVPGGAAGFTVTWDTDHFPNGNRVAVLMANGLLPGRTAVASNPPPPELKESQPSPVTPPPATPPSPPPPKQIEVDRPKPVGPKTVVVAGSAFYVGADGTLMTNNHVVAGCDGATVVGVGPAAIVARDGKNDLALLRLAAGAGGGLATPVGFRPAPLQLGESAYVLGYPYAGALNNGVNFTSGMISSVAGMDNDSTRFQLTAPVQPGNSGGPVLDQSGALVGIVVSRMSDVAALQITQTVPQNVNFGIKAEVVASFLRANGIAPQPARDAAARQATEVAAIGKVSTAQIECTRPAGEADR